MGGGRCSSQRGPGDLRASVRGASGRKSAGQGPIPVGLRCGPVGSTTAGAALKRQRAAPAWLYLQHLHTAPGRSVGTPCRRGPLRLAALQVPAPRALPNPSALHISAAVRPGARMASQEPGAAAAAAAAGDDSRQLVVPPAQPGVAHLCVEYPGYVADEQRVLETLGGAAGIAHQLQVRPQGQAPWGRQFLAACAAHLPGKATGVATDATHREARLTLLLRRTTRSSWRCGCGPGTTTATRRTGHASPRAACCSSSAARAAAPTAAAAAAAAAGAQRWWLAFLTHTASPRPPIINT